MTNRLGLARCSISKKRLSHAHVSRNDNCQFQKNIFLRKCGMLTGLRMEVAAQALHESRRSIAQVAEAVDYASEAKTIEAGLAHCSLACLCDG
jgi:AraC-like DNA-binding protein